MSVAFLLKLPFGLNKPTGRLGAPQLDVAASLSIPEAAVRFLRLCESSGQRRSYSFADLSLLDESTVTMVPCPAANFQPSLRVIQMSVNGRVTCGCWLNR